MNLLANFKFKKIYQKYTKCFKKHFPGRYLLEKSRTMENKGEILIYENADRQTQVEVKLDADSVWLTQKQMAEFI